MKSLKIISNQMFYWYNIRKISMLATGKRKSAKLVVFFLAAATN